MVAVRATQVTGIPVFQYPMDIVVANEQTLYVVDAVADGFNGVIYEINLPNAPDSVAGASAQIIASGLHNPVALAYATQANTLAVCEVGPPTVGRPVNAGSGGRISSVFGIGIIPTCADPASEDTFPPDKVLGPRGIAYNPSGTIMYGVDHQGFLITNWVQQSIWAWVGGTSPKQYILYGGFSTGSFDFWGPFNDSGPMKITRDGAYLVYGMGAFFSNSTVRGWSGQPSFGSPPPPWQEYNFNAGWMYVGGARRCLAAPWDYADATREFPAPGVGPAATTGDFVSRWSVPSPVDGSRLYTDFAWRSAVAPWLGGGILSCDMAPSGAAYVVSGNASTGSGDGFSSDSISYGTPQSTGFLVQIYQDYPTGYGKGGDYRIPYVLDPAYSLIPGPAFLGLDSYYSPSNGDDYPPYPETVP